MPASSMCCWMPPIQAFRPSQSASTSSSTASSRKRSIRTGCSGELATAVLHVGRPGAPRRTRPPSRARRARRRGARPAGSRCGARPRAPPPRSRASACGGAARPSSPSSRPKRPAVLGEVDRLGRGAPDRVARGLERPRELERRLAAELHEDAVGLLVVEDRRDVLERQRLEVEPVGRVVVGRDRLGVAVDHDRLEAGLRERVAGVDAAVVELDPLADPVGPAAEDRRPCACPSGSTRSRPRRSSRSTASPPRTRPRRCRSSCRRGGRRAPGAARGPRLLVAAHRARERPVGEAEALGRAELSRGRAHRG